MITTRHLKHQFIMLFVVGMVFIFSSTALSQDPILRSFSPYETCNQHHVSHDYVFIGKVKNSYTKKLYRIGNSGNLADFVIEVVQPVKGNISKSIILTIEFFSNEDFSHFVIGNELIFTADKNTRSGLKGEFVSRYWSTPIGNTPSKIINQKVKEIKRVTKGSKRPRIYGKIVQHYTSPHYFKFAYFDGEYELGYDPKYLKSPPKISITAKATDGKIYKTFTDKQGKYKFVNLPNDRYQISLSLPVNYQVKFINDEMYFLEKHFFVMVNDDTCGNPMNFAVSRVGSLRAEIDLGKVSWEKPPSVQLVAVNPTNRKLYNGFIRLPNEIKLDKKNNKLTVIAEDVVEGEYILELELPNSTRYISIPIVKNRIAQETICITFGKTTKVKLAFGK